MIRYPEIDETKLPEVMKLIETAASIMEETGCLYDEKQTAARKELESLYQKLRDITANPDIKTGDYAEYWSYTSLETVARKALFGHPQKSNMTDEQLSEIIQKIYNMDFDVSEDEAEAINDYFLDLLTIETGLGNLTDYIYYPEEAGLAPDAGLDDITAKILADKMA